LLGKLRRKKGDFCIDICGSIRCYNYRSIEAQISSANWPQIFLGYYIYILFRIHVKDLAELVHHSIKNEHVSGVLNGVAPQLISNQVTCFIYKLEHHSQRLESWYYGQYGKFFQYWLDESGSQFEYSSCMGQGVDFIEQFMPSA
jgi:hypothetical protein